MPKRKAVRKAATSKSPKYQASPPQIQVPDTGKQVFVAAFLAQVRKTGLHTAISDASAAIDPKRLRDEIVACAPADGLALLHGTGVRDEEVFATPAILFGAPGTIAYYRLLLGISKKQFYQTSTGLNSFKAMEERQEVTEGAKPRVPDLCVALNIAMGQLLHALPAGSLRIDVEQLPLLTLGAQADGSWRTQIGTKATKQVFEALKKIVNAATRRKHPETESSITVTNNSRREVTLMLAPDPDIVIREKFGTDTVYKVAIEIKGGTDYSNIHNRVGEAEKSHQKAREDEAGDCWTVIHLKHADMAKLKQESPATRQWIDMADVLAGSGADWTRLVRLTKAAMGI